MTLRLIALQELHNIGLMGVADKIKDDSAMAVKNMKEADGLMRY